VLDVMRRIPIGRSRRAWAWAGAALAAGLLIMVVEREPAPDADVPREIARREAETGDRALSPLRWEAAEEPPTDGRDAVASSPPASAPAAAPTPGVAGGGGFGGGGVLHRSESPPAPSSAEAVATAESGARRFLGEELLEERSSGEADVELLVVHVNARPEALEQKLFDAMLARNGITVEEPSEPATSELRDESVDTLSRSGVTGSRTSAAESSRAGEQSEVDVVLVEAPPAQIYGCLAEIDADRANYLGIEVDDALVPAERAAANRSSNLDWKQHERGSVPVKQRLQVAPDNNLYLEADGKQYALGGGEAGESSRERADAAKDKLELATQGRAMRVQPQFGADYSGMAAGKLAKGADAPSQAPAAGYEFDQYKRHAWGLVRRGAPALSAKADMLQVLFVLSADDEPATSPPASDEVR
jgi:hypothetical protein